MSYVAVYPLSVHVRSVSEQRLLQRRTSGVRRCRTPGRLVTDSELSRLAAELSARSRERSDVCFMPIAHDGHGSPRADGNVCSCGSSFGQQ